ncbi:hypothetical protein, partial [Rhodopseudomonas sp. BAL398]|uniref:hypothetical protein n=1 Tax=Rhodopseudomonas sp. BAL398 TaxID=3034676 RepID=UPI0023E10929
CPLLPLPPFRLPPAPPPPPPAPAAPAPPPPPPPPPPPNPESCGKAKRFSKIPGSLALRALAPE